MNAGGSSSAVRLGGPAMKAALMLLTSSALVLSTVAPAVGAGWQNDTTGSRNLPSGTKVAVVDTGVDPRRIGGRVSVSVGPEIVVGKQSNVDDDGHGSLVSAFLADIVDGASPRSTIVPVRAWGTAATTSSSLTRSGLSSAIKLGARVINLSFGGGTTSEGFSDLVASATSHGAIVVAASGNDGRSEPIYPAATPGVVAVGSIGPDWRPSSFSNTGPHVALVAPGEDLSYLGRTVSGTSFAAPQVSGVVAGLISAHPFATPAEITSALYRSAIDLGPVGRDDRTGYGLVDAVGADIILSGSAATRTSTTTRTNRNPDGSTTLVIAVTQNSKPAPGVGFSVLGYQRQARTHVVLATGTTGSDGTASLRLRLQEDHTIFVRTTADDKHLASAGEPTDVKSMTQRVSLQLTAETNRLTVLATGVDGAPVGGLVTTVWVRYGSTWYSVGDIDTTLDGRSSIDAVAYAGEYSVGDDPGTITAVVNDAPQIRVLSATHGDVDNRMVGVSILDPQGHPVVGLPVTLASAAGKTSRVSSMDGSILFPSSSGSLSWQDEATFSNGTRVVNDVFAAHTAANSFTLQTRCVVTSAGTKAVFTGTVLNRGQGASGVTMVLQRKTSSGWVDVRRATSDRSGQVKMTTSPAKGVSIWRVTARTSDGVIDGSPVKLNRP